MLTFFIVIFLLLMQFLWKYIDDLAGKGLNAGIISELLLYTSASLVPMALPLAILLASLMTFGNLGENYELLALKSAGISLQRIMFPLIIMIILLSVMAFFFSNNVMPYANLKMRSLLYDVQQKRPEFQIREGIFYNGIDNYSIKISDKDNKTNLLTGIKIYDHTDRKGNIKVTIADSGYMKMTADSNLIMILYNGYSYNDIIPEDRRRRVEDSYPFRRDRFDKQEFVLPLSGFDFNRTDEDLFKSGYQMMNLDQLKKTVDSLKYSYTKIKDRFVREMIITNYLRSDMEFRDSFLQKDTLPDYDASKKINKALPDTIYEALSIDEKKRVITQALNYTRAAKSQLSSQDENFYSKVKRIRRHEIEWHRKFTLSVACFIFFFIGAPLGAIIRKGGLGMPVVVSILFFVFYYVISLTGEKFVREDMIPAWQGMWLSSIILMPLGVFLTYKATTDSVILSTEAYTEFFKKVIRIAGIKKRESASNNNNQT